MTTMAGIVAVNRAVWGEPPDRSPPDVATLGHSTADSHLRQLCASCHLGAPKAEPAPVTESSRGGGCTACHVSYSGPALAALERFRSDRMRRAGVAHPTVHPDVSLRMDNGHCFGCHSRSGRISLSYEGWHEANPATSSRVTRTLEDGRVVVQVAPDAHWEKRMICIDCHTAREVMGDGTMHLRKLSQARIACADCHPRNRVETMTLDRLDEESRRIVALRAGPGRGRPLVAAASGDVFVNAFLDEQDRPRLARKADGVVLDLRPSAAVCTANAHEQVSCIGCHTAWAPRCLNCHTRFDPARAGYDLLADREVRGEWLEEGSQFTAEPPTLGVRSTTGAATGGRGRLVEPFIPGMIVTLERPGGGGAARDRVFRRLYARAFSHTVTRAGRSCRSCHNDPVALGYGKGRLDYTGTPGRGRWTFVPAHPPGPDGLPADAWVPFLESRNGFVSTRDDGRPFTIDEQRRVLTAGACLTCHAEDSPVMKASLRDFAAVLRRMSPKCSTPVW
jgi:hypothetical protein